MSFISAHNYCVQWLRFFPSLIDRYKSRAHSGFVPRVGGLLYTCFTSADTPSVFFIPLSVVIDLDVEKLTLLILSAAPVFTVGLAEDFFMICRPARLMHLLFLV